MTMTCARIARRMQKMVLKTLLNWALLKNDDMSNAKDDRENSVKMWNRTMTVTEVLMKAK